MTAPAITIAIYWGHRQAIAAGMGGDVVYDDGTNRLSLPAVFGRSEFPVDVAGELRMAHVDRDFIVRADQFVDGDGIAIVPQKAARITMAAAGVFEVLAPAGERCFRTAGPNGELLRIRAKKV